jgi:hypothetical protein
MKDLVRWMQLCKFQWNLLIKMERDNYYIGNSTVFNTINTNTIFRAIINHFSPKIEAWLASQGLSTPSEDQVN